MKLIVATIAFMVAVSLNGPSDASARVPVKSSVRTSIQKSLAVLDGIRMPFIEETGCVSCHNNALPAMTVALARARGFQLNEQTSLRESEQILAIWSAGREQIMQGDGFGGSYITAAYTLLDLAANRQPPNKTTDA